MDLKYIIISEIARWIESRKHFSDIEFLKDCLHYDFDNKKVNELTIRELKELADMLGIKIPFDNKLRKDTIKQ